MRPLATDLTEFKMFIKVEREEMEFGQTVEAAHEFRQHELRKLHLPLRCQNRPVNRDTGLKMPCCLVTDLLWV